MQQYLATGRLLRVTVDHCNYAPSDELSYAKATDYFTNLEWKAKGYSGDGRCGRQGVRTGVRCSHGWLNDESGRWNHYNTIAQASQDEISGDSYHRKSQENHLPHLECLEFLKVAVNQWKQRPT